MEYTKTQLKTVSVVIPARNEQGYIGRCIESFLAQDYPAEYIKILVIDGMSTDGTRDIVLDYAARYSNVVLLDNQQRITPIALNIGIKASDSDVVIIFGAHAFADKSFIRNNVRALVETGADCVGGLVENVSEGLIGEMIALGQSSPFGVGNARFRYAKEAGYVDTVAFGAFRRELFDIIGYFDEELARNQDDEFSFRIIEHGGKIWFSPDIRSYYYTRSSLTKLWRQYYQYGLWKVRVIQKYGRPASIRHLVPMAFVLSIVVMGVLSPIYEFFKYLLLAILSAYAVVNIVVSIVTAIKKRKSVAAIYLPLIFAILHCSYGTGFIEGIWNFYIVKGDTANDRYRKLTR